jgi:hypothetical protein
MYENGALVREQSDQDLDGRLELTTSTRRRARALERGPEWRRERPTCSSSTQGGAKSEQREDRNFDGKDDVVTKFDAQERPRASSRTPTRTGTMDTVNLYEAGVLVRTEKDRNGDGKPDVIASYRNGEIDRQQEDSDFDGRMDRKSAAGSGGSPRAGSGLGRKRRDRHLDHHRRRGRRAAQGRGPQRRRQARSLRVVRGGKLAAGRAGHEGQRLRRPEAVVRRRREGARRVPRHERRLQDRRLELLRERADRPPGARLEGRGSPDVLNYLNADGTVRVQELASGANGASPDKKLFLAADGSVVSQCCSATTRSGSPRARS